ncbi:MAG: SCO1664 family protein [Chloroflexota bacterium]
MDRELLVNAFSGGSIELKGQFTLGSNYTFLVNLMFEGQEIPAVYKPQKGEQPLWDFPENTLTGREVAAYLVSETLGWSLVPYTIFRQDAPYGPGSLQQYINYNPNYHYFNLKPGDKEKLRPVVLFDHLTNNADRKGSHILFEKRSRHLYAIDHGLCFNVDEKLRSVIWDFAGEAVAPELLASLQALIDPDPRLISDLLVYLNQDELVALSQRARSLTETGTFPQPPSDRRAFPYPPL